MTVVTENCYLTKTIDIVCRILYKYMRSVYSIIKNILAMKYDYV